MLRDMFDNEWLRGIQKQAELLQSFQRSVNMDVIRGIQQAGQRQRYELDQIERMVNAMRMPLAVSESYRAVASMRQSIEAVARMFDALPTGLFETLQKMQTTWLEIARVTEPFVYLQQQLGTNLTQLLQEQARVYQMMVGEERDRFTQVFVSCADYMLYAALRVLRNEEDAQDVVQESYMKAVSWLATHGLGNMRSEGLRKWLYTVARNTALDLLRKRQRLVSFEMSGIDVSLQCSFEQPEANLLCQELYQAVRDGFRALSEIQHKVIFMRYFGKEDGWEAIAAFLKCPVSTVRVHHTRGVRVLRKHLNRYAGSIADLAEIMDAFAQEPQCIEHCGLQDE